jgi:hypothetical protein
VLSVEPYAEDEDDPIGCRVSIPRPASMSELEWAALIKGHDPESVNLVAPIENGFALHFTSTGYMDTFSRPLSR